MCSLCRLPVAKNYNFGQILTFWGPLHRRPFTDEGQIWCAIADPRSTLSCQISSRSLYSVARWRRKTPNFCQFLRFFGLRHLLLSPIGNSLTKFKVEHGCTTTNLPLPNGIKIVSVLQRLHGEIARTNSDVQKRDGQTNKQTKKLDVFGPPPTAGEIRAPPNLAW